MQSLCFEDERGIEGAKTELFPFLGDPMVPTTATEKSFENQRGATNMVASSNHCIFIVSRDHLDEKRKALKKKRLT